MDKIKKMFDNLTGGDGKVDASDIENTVGDLQNTNLQDLKLGDMDLGILQDLTKLDFPITKAEVVQFLKDQNASGTVIAVVQQAPEEIFNTVNDLRKHLPF